MCRRSGFPTIITVAMFVLTWSSNLNVQGVPDRLEQCRARGYDVACPYTETKRQCEILFCGNMRADGTYELYRVLPQKGVADGTPCAPSKICRNKKCVDAGQAIVRWPDEDDFITCVTVKNRMRSTKANLIKTREHQCKRYGFDVACQMDKYSCTRLQCGYQTSEGHFVQKSWDKFPFAIRPTIGTWCGEGKICYKEKCILESRWPRSKTKPTYTGCEYFRQCTLEESCK